MTVDFIILQILFDAIVLIAIAVNRAEMGAEIDNLHDKIMAYLADPIGSVSPMEGQPELFDLIIVDREAP